MPEQQRGGDGGITVEVEGARLVLEVGDLLGLLARIDALLEQFRLHLGVQEGGDAVFHVLAGLQHGGLVTDDQVAEQGVGPGPVAQIFREAGQQPLIVGVVRVTFQQLLEEPARFLARGGVGLDCEKPGSEAELVHVFGLAGRGRGSEEFLGASGALPALAG